METQVFSDPQSLDFKGALGLLQIAIENNMPVVPRHIF